MGMFRVAHRSLAGRLMDRPNLRRTGAEVNPHGPEDLEVPQRQQREKHPKDSSIQNHGAAYSVGWNQQQPIADGQVLLIAFGLDPWRRVVTLSATSLRAP